MVRLLFIIFNFLKLCCKLFFIFSLASWPSLALDSLKIADHSVLSSALILHLLTPRALKFASASSSHLNSCLPTFRLPSGFQFTINFGRRSLSILITLPNHSNLRVLFSATLSGDLYWSFNSILYRILQVNQISQTRGSP